MKRKKIMFIAGALIIFLILVFWNFMVKNNPRRTLRSYFRTVQEHRAAAVKTFFGENPDMVPATEEWISSQNAEFTIQEEVAWREDKERFKPFSKYLSSHYKADVKVSWDDKEKEFVFHLAREGANNAWSILGNIYRDWSIQEIKKEK